MSIANLFVPNNYDLNCNDLDVAGEMNIIGPTVYSGDVTVTPPGKLITSVIRPALPNGSLVVEANGIQVFDMQTSLSRANALEVNGIDAKTPGNSLELGGANALNIEVQNDILPNADNVIDLGDVALRYNNTYSENIFSSALHTDTLTANTLNNNLVLSGNGAGVIECDDDIIPTTTDLRFNGTLANRWVDVVTARIRADEIRQAGAGFVTVASNLTPSTNITFDLGSNAERYRNVYIGTGLYLPSGGSALTYYAQNVVIPVTYSGALVGAMDITASRVGNICTLHIPQIFGASAATATIDVIGIPAAYSPAAIGGVTGMYVCFNNSINQAARYYIDSTGLTFYGAVTGGTFANTGNCGTQADISISFLAA